MADHIPFVSGPEAAAAIKHAFADSSVVRVPADRAEKLLKASRSESKKWIDPCFDGCEDFLSRDSKSAWYEFVTSFPNIKQLEDKAFIARPEQSQVDPLVSAILRKCAEYRPSWITVPQLPISAGPERHKINKALAVATGRWKSKSNFAGQLILPLVFGKHSDLNKKAIRNPKLKFATKCYQDSRADGYWVVDSSMSDEDGSAKLRSQRFQCVIALHDELDQLLPSKIRIGGPYWGLNLVLWARSLIDFPMIGTGTGFQYFISGGYSTKPKPRIAIPSLFRRVSVAGIPKWLDASIDGLPVGHPALGEFEGLRKKLSLFNDESVSRRQVTQFYKAWFDRIDAVPKGGRSMALFQDLSAAYALGRLLTPIESEGTTKRPESIAEALMLNCL